MTRSPRPLATLLFIVTLVGSLGAAQVTGQPAPEITPGGKWFNSKPLSLAALRGKVVLLNFWTAECSNCTRSMPTLKAWLERYQKLGLTVIGVHTPETKWQKPAEIVAQWIKRERITWAVVQDNDNALWNAYGADAWPTFYLIDRHGVLRDVERGELSASFPAGIAPLEGKIKVWLKAR
jgi:peroxiredoxin